MVKEKIICSAIWFKDFPLIIDELEKGFIRPINCNKGIVFCGLRHYNCLYQAVAITGKYRHQLGECIEGFLTSANRFVNRTEAREIYISDGGKVEFGELFSEDLY
jgi:hypothetical protein